MMVVQINDQGFWRGCIYLRQMYDLFLLSQNCDPLAIASGFGRYFHRFNAYLAISTKLLGKPSCFSYVPTWQAKLYLRRIRIDVTYPKFARSYKFPLIILEQLSSYLRQPIQAIYRKDIRQTLYSKLSDPGWYGRHFRKLRERL